MSNNPSETNWIRKEDHLSPSMSGEILSQLYLEDKNLSSFSLKQERPPGQMSQNMLETSFEMAPFKCEPASDEQGSKMIDEVEKEME